MGQGEMGIPVDTRVLDLLLSEAPVIGQTPLAIARFGFAPLSVEGAALPSTWWYWYDQHEANALA